uniref:Uncharacterized protein n=1 Tax=Solanum tuberosum TaxID=4113 RepID=M1E0J1_SOLTU
MRKKQKKENEDEDERGSNNRRRKKKTQHNHFILGKIGSNDYFRHGSEDKSGKSDQVWNHGARRRSVDLSTDRTVDP